MMVLLPCLASSLVWQKGYVTDVEPRAIYTHCIAILLTWIAVTLSNGAS